MARLRHFVIRGTATSVSYTAIGSGGGKKYKSPPSSESRIERGTRLVKEIRTAAEQIVEKPEKAAEGIPFIPIVVRSENGVSLDLDGLNSKRTGTEVVAFRSGSDRFEEATIHLSKDKLPKFMQKFEDYAHKNTINSNNSSEKTPRNQKLVESISEISPALIKNGNYCTDLGSAPACDEELWWEVWLQNNIQDKLILDGRELIVEQIFREEAKAQGIRTSDCQVKFLV